MKTQDKADATKLTGLSLSEASALVRAKKVSPVELTEACLGRIDRLDAKLNTFITVTAESALEQARTAEAAIQRGEWIGPLHGIPVALKDLIETAGVRTTAGSGLNKDRVPSKDAEVVRRLKAAGAVLLGKLNMHEFAYGGSGVIGYFGAAHNPWASDCNTGGSSSGAAAAVAAGLCYAAVATDTGGSVREPAAFCGIVGLKPTYGRVSTRGVIPLAWTLDHVGPIARSVTDAALMLQAIAGYDEDDATSVDAAVPDYAQAFGDAAQLRLGIPSTFFYDALEPEIDAAVRAALAVLGKLTASVRPIDVPLDRDTTTLKTEAYAYHRELIAKSPELYQPVTLERIRSGAEVSAADYIAGRRQTEELRRSVRKEFDDVDLLVTPTTCVLPSKISDLLANLSTLRAKENLMLRNTRPFNAMGLPTISIPCGFSSSGLPIGLQISGPPWGEAIVLRMAFAYEQATDWHKRAPNLQ
jgi:aspartyl-tRNA(Asn)/glutamyl-tRNA(Gln) amidotransferase subunit A